jgi:hypothetical protein
VKTVFSVHEPLNNSSLNCQKLAAEQRLIGQAVRTDLPSFHHGPNHAYPTTTLIQLSRTSIRTNTLAFGLLGRPLIFTHFWRQGAVKTPILSASLTVHNTQYFYTFLLTIFTSRTANLSLVKLIILFFLRGRKFLCIF